MALLKDLTVYGASRFIGDAFGAYIYATLFNTSGGNMGDTAFSRVYVSNDSFIRWKSKTDFIAEIRDSGGLDSIYVKKIGDTMTGALTINPGNASPALKITSTGSHVIDALNANLSANNEYLFMIGKASSSKNAGIIRYVHNTDGGNNNRLSFGLYSQNDVLNILGSGNVGINTTTPTEKLDVNGYVYATGYKKSNSSDSYVLLGGGGHALISSLSVANANKIKTIFTENGGNHYLTFVDSNNKPDPDYENLYTNEGIFFNPMTCSFGHGIGLVALGEYSHAEGHYTNVTRDGFSGHAEGRGTMVTNSAAHAEGHYTSANGGNSHAEGRRTMANGNESHAEGSYTSAIGEHSHAEGYCTYAMKSDAHAEGHNTFANELHTHAEGYETIANSSRSHVEGYQTTSYGYNSHAEGWRTITYGDNSHVEGYATISYGNHSHAEGHNTYTYGQDSHTEGEFTFAFGENSHAEGSHNYSCGPNSHVEGLHNYTYGGASHAEGSSSYAYSFNTHVEGHGNIAGIYENIYLGESGETAHAEGLYTIARSTAAHSEGTSTRALGESSHAEGHLTTTRGYDSHAEGYLTEAGGDYSHAEGYHTLSNSSTSHAEGYETVSNGYHSHVEGQESKTYGINSHAEGYKTISRGENSHAEGHGTETYGQDSHAEGEFNLAIGENSHAEGSNNIANGDDSHVEGLNNYTYGNGSHAEGSSNKSYSFDTHTEGFGNQAGKEGNVLSGQSGQMAHAEGYYTTASGTASHSEGKYTLASGSDSHAEGYNTEALGEYSHAEGRYTTAFGKNSHAEGYYTIASYISSHAEGSYTMAYSYSHAEGYNSYALAYYSHAEGYYSVATKNGSHAEGGRTTSSGTSSHAEGYQTTASGLGSHAEGYRTTASGDSSHASGYYTQALHDYEAAFGKYNVSNSDTIFSIGGGSGNNNRLNIFEVKNNGQTYAQIFYSREGEMTTSTQFSRVYVSNDGFIRWKSKANFASEMKESGAMDGRWVLKAGDIMTGNLSMSNNEIQNVNNLYINNQILFSSSIDIKYPSSGSTSGRILMSNSDGIDISSNASKKINIHTNSNEIDISSSGFYVNANGDDMIRLSNTGSSNYINGNTNLIIYGGSNGSISFKSSSPGINYNKATWVENLKSLIINSDKSIEMYGSGGNCYFYAGTDGNPYKMEIGSNGVSYIKFDKTGIADFYGEVRFRDAVTFKGIATHEKDVLPSNNNGKNLGSSSYRWKKLYIGTADSYGSTNRPIYWNNGAPAECNYSLNATVNSGTPNRIAYYSGANAISSGSITSDGTYLGNVNYLSINTAHQTNYRLYVNGDSYVSGWSRAANGFYVHDQGVHYTYQSSGIPLIYLTSNEFNFSIGSSISSPTLYFNYSSSRLGKTVSEYKWHGGSSNTWATHYFGTVYHHLNNDTTYYLKIGLSNSNYARYETNATTGHYFNKTIEVDGQIKIANSDPIVCINNTDGMFYGHGVKKINSSNDYVLLGGGGHELISNLSVANADTVDGYHHNHVINYNNSYGPYTIPTNTVWFLKLQTSNWVSDDYIVYGKASGNNINSDFVLHIMCRGNKYWGWQTSYNGVLATGIYKETGSSEIIYLEIPDYITSISFKSTCTLTITKHIPGDDSHCDTKLYQDISGEGFFANYIYGTMQFASSSNSIKTIASSTNAKFYFTFVDSNNTPIDDYEYLYTNNELFYNPGIGAFGHGYQVTASGTNSHAEGYKTQAIGYDSHAEGSQTIASGDYSHAEGDQAQAQGDHSHAEGKLSISYGTHSHAEGESTQAIGGHSHTEGKNTQAQKANSHAEGYGTVAGGEKSHAEGEGSEALGEHAHAESFYTKAYGAASHAEGYKTQAGIQGGNTLSAEGHCSHAEGEETKATGSNSHAEGYFSEASGRYAHAENYYTYATGWYSHAQGHHAYATANQSFAGGYYTRADHENEVAFGKYNASNSDTIFSIGGGSSGSRYNLFEVTTDGKLKVRKDTYLCTYSGSVGIGTTTPGAKFHVNGGDGLITGSLTVGTNSLYSDQLYVSGNARITSTLDILNEARLKIWNVTSTRNSGYGAEMVFLQTSIDSADPSSSWPDKNRNDLFIQPYGGHITFGERRTHHDYTIWVQGNSYFNGAINAATTIWAGGSTASSEPRIGVDSFAGTLYMFSQHSSSGGRGLYMGAHGTGSADSVIYIDTNNNVTFNGYLNGNADQLDGYHASGLFTEFLNSHSSTNHQLSITIGGTNKTCPVDYLNAYNTITYGNNGLQYFNIHSNSQGTATTNGTPTDDWYHIIRMNHGNSAGYYCDIATCFHSWNLWYRRIVGGSDCGWMRVVDANNCEDIVTKCNHQFHQKNQGTWTRILQFTINSGSLTPTISFRWHPTECARDIWADFNINIRQNDINFYSVYHASGTRTLKCVGDGTTFSVWVKGTKSDWDPYGLLQIVTQYGINSYDTTLAYQDGEPSSTYNKYATTNVSDEVPVGTIMMWYSTTVPNGWLLCNGGSFSSSEYPELYNVLGATKLPDFTGCVPIGIGTRDGYTFTRGGTNGGEYRHTLTESEMPTHYHSINLKDYYGLEAGWSRPISGQDDVGSGWQGIGNNDFDNSHLAYYRHNETTNSTGGGGSHNNIQPSCGIYFIIKAKSTGGSSGGGSSSSGGGSGSISHQRVNDTTYRYVLGTTLTSNTTLSTVYSVSQFYFTNAGAYHTSDARKKYDIRDLLNEDINKLFETENGFIRHFKWKDSNIDSYGFIAQELQEYCPEAVDFNTDGNYYAVNYNVAFSKIIGAMFKKIKELENKLKENGIS